MLLRIELMMSGLVIENSNPEGAHKVTTDTTVIDYRGRPQSVAAADAPVVDDTDTPPVKTKHAITMSWLNQYKRADFKPTDTCRSAWIIRSLMLQAETKLLGTAHSRESTTNISFTKAGGNSKGLIATAMASKTLQTATFVFGGRITLEATKSSYHLCDVGHHALHVDGSDDACYPFLAWSIPASADETEISMELFEIEHTLEVGKGSAIITIPVKFLAAKLTEDPSSMRPFPVVLVRPHLPCETKEGKDCRKEALKNSVKLSKPSKPLPYAQKLLDLISCGEDSTLAKGEKRSASTATGTQATNKDTKKARQTKLQEQKLALGSLATLLDGIDKKSGDLCLLY